MRKMRGFTLIELLIVVAIIAILAAIAVPNFLEAQVRAKVSRVRSDLRSLATALESYFIDNNAYPVLTTTQANGVNASLNLGTGAGLLPVFRIRLAGDEFQTLTTPLAYITSYFSDPFAITRGLTFSYYTDTAGWIIWSLGPDSDENNGSGIVASDLGPGQAYETVYTSVFAQPSQTLIAGDGGSPGNAFTYDPTNGTTSEGDVYRVRQ